MAAIRAKVMSLMRKALKAGQSRTAFLRDMKAEGLTYPRKTMFADWAQLKDFHDKEGTLAAVGRDAYPAEKNIITTAWDIDKEFMYQVKVRSRLRPEEPITERFVNIVTAKPMTPRMMVQSLVEKWVEWEYEPFEAVEELIPWTAVRTTQPRTP